MSYNFNLNILLLCLVLILAPVSLLSDGDYEFCVFSNDPVSMECCNSINFIPNKITVENECMKESPPPTSPAPLTVSYKGEFENLTKNITCYGFFRVPSNENTTVCDFDICVGEKLGYSDARGRINRKVLQEMLQAQFKDQPSTVQMLSELCVYGSLFDFGSPDDCELMKMKLCIESQLFTHCIDWNEDPKCFEIKDIADQCKGKIILPGS